jgi:transposase
VFGNVCEGGMRALSVDLRRRIIEGRQEGNRAEEVAKRFRVCKRTVERLWKRYCEEGPIECCRRGGYRRSRLVGHEKKVMEWLQKEPDMTFPELSRRCSGELEVQLSPSHLSRCLAKLGLSFKKTIHAAEQERRDVREARSKWRSKQVHWDARHLVFWMKPD